MSFARAPSGSNGQPGERAIPALTASPTDIEAGVPHTPIVRITSEVGRFSPRLSELWDYRELLYFLAWRDIKVRYKQTLLGGAWAIIQPLFTMLVFAVFFGYLGRIPSDGLPYPIFVYTALVPWQLFSYALVETSRSLVANERLLTKIYFPRLVIPVAALGAGLVDFAIAFGMLVLMMAWYGIVPGLAILMLPVFVVLATAAALAAGLWLSALNVQYRDIRYTVTFLTQVWLFATPVAYPASLVPAAWRTFYGLNPMTGVVEGFRWAVLGSGELPVGSIAVSSAVVLTALVGGLWYFRRMERTFADTV